jgi:membrane protein YqaA with SNARE-associated domain
MTVNKHWTPNSTALTWGFAEATFFFIVPDVFIAYRGLRGYKPALIACLYALIGALLGGSILFLWSLHSQASLHFVQHVPGVTAPMLQSANMDYAHHGVSALLIAPTRGIPYKLYTVVAPRYHIAFLAFLLFSVIARLARFVAVALVTATLSTALKNRINYKYRLAILVTFWLIFYGLYFYHNH